MPFCHKCKVMLPPDICEPTGPGTHICYFCKENKTHIMMEGSEVSKDFLHTDYLGHLDKLAQKYKENQSMKMLADEIKKYEMLKDKK